MDPAGEIIEGVVIVDRNQFGREDGSAIHAFVGNVMHHHTRVLALAGEELGVRSFDCTNSRKFTRQRRMQVDHSDCPNDSAGQEPHPSRKHDEIGLERGDGSEESSVVARAWLIRLWWQRHRRDARGGGSYEGMGMRTIRDHPNNASGAQFVRALGVEQRLQVGTRTRGEHDDACHGRINSTRSPSWWGTSSPIIQVGSSIAFCRVVASLAAHTITMPIPMFSIR